MNEAEATDLIREGAEVLFREYGATDSTAAMISDIVFGVLTQLEQEAAGEATQ